MLFRLCFYIDNYTTCSISILLRCPVSLPVKECTEEQNKILASDTYCGKINPDRQEGVTPFADCLKSDAKMAKEMFDACIVDVCMNLGGPYEKEALCLAIDAVAQNCRKNDFEYDEWRKPDFCRKYYYNFNNKIL